MSDCELDDCKLFEIKEEVEEEEEVANEVSLNLLPEISKERYQSAYDKLMDWRQVKHFNSFSENILLVYFEELSQKYKSSTLWAQYSMLRNMIKIKHNIDISEYPKLRTFLKRKSENYVPKKSKTLTPEDFNKFLNSAPDEIYLLTKAVVAVGLSGACRREEMCNLTVDNVEDLKSAMLIKTKKSKNKIPRSFTVTGSFYDILKKYASLRPPSMSEKRFFLNYRQGKCTKQVVGINKIGGVAKEIATFLKLENPELYTGHCFRRSSASLLVNTGSDLVILKGHGGWKTSAVAEEYMDGSTQNKIRISKIVESDEHIDESSRHGQQKLHILQDHGERSSINVEIENLLSKETPVIIFRNCSNITINYNCNKE